MHETRHNLTMKISQRHAWPLTVEEAIAIQEQLRGEVIASDQLEPVPIPDLILCDGQGIAHPRRFGIGCHLGLIMDIPTIGVAKSLLIGKHEEVPEQRGSWQPLVNRGETIGAVLRTRTGTKPLYVSSGHRVSLPTAIEYVLRCTPKYRLPETTRIADKLASG